MAEVSFFRITQKEKRHLLAGNGKHRTCDHVLMAQNNNLPLFILEHFSVFMEAHLLFISDL